MSTLDLLILWIVFGFQLSSMKLMYNFTQENVWLTMPDGIRLSASLAIPISKFDNEKFPVLLEYKPYRKDDSFYNFNQLKIYSMKKITICLALAVAIFSACNQATKKEAAPASATTQDSTAAAGPDYSKLAFASDKDLSCGMPLSAGVQDTAMVGDKIYGFCSKECKHDFLAHQEQYLKKQK